MPEQRQIMVSAYRQRGENVLVFYASRFLLLPSCEAVIVGNKLVFDEKTLEAAYDVTPDLPEAILRSAWQHEQVFLSEVSVEWAASVARSCASWSAHSILQAYQKRQGVINE